MTKTKDIDILLYIDNLDIKNLNAADHLIVDNLCKKIDVAQTLRCFYNFDASKSINNKLQSKMGMQTIVRKLIEYFKEYKDYKVLNSLLKISDGILLNKNKFILDEDLKHQIIKLAQ